MLLLLLLVLLLLLLPLLSPDRFHFTLQVVGFSHGSAALPHSKSIFFPMEEIAAGYNMLEEDERPLGFMFW